MYDDDHPKHFCAVFGIYGTNDAAAHTALGLHALQHRGQEGTGIVSWDGKDFYAHRALGHVADAYSNKETMKRLVGHAAVGHNRYSTTGAPMLRNVQPLFAEIATGGISVAHNGNLTNARTLRKELIRTGSIFQSTTDTEILVHLLATGEGPFEDRLVSALQRVQGAYALVMMTKDGLIGARDPVGIRPLMIGKLADGVHILASETVALDIVGATFVREVKAGEIIIINGDGIRSIQPAPDHPARLCIFEHVYFSRPDSFMNGQSVYQVRKNIGAELAKESPADVDMVVPVPDSGNPAALGYAQESGIPFEFGIIRNHYVGRTFIEPQDHIRHLGVKLKHNANRMMLKGKKVVLVDDSIVRGTTSVKIVEMVREAGATEVHMRVASPPIKHPCYYGIDMATEEELLANRMTIEEMKAHIGVDSLAFVTIDGLYRAAGEPGRDPENPKYTDHYFTGDYPVPLIDKEGGAGKEQLSLLQDLGEQKNF